MKEDELVFDPYAILRELDEAGVWFVLIGGLARVIQGSDEVTTGLDGVPLPAGDLGARHLEALGELGLGEAGALSGGANQLAAGHPRRSLPWCLASVRRHTYGTCVRRGSRATFTANMDRGERQADPRVERPRTLSFAQAAREYGLQPEDVRALVAAGVAWTVTPPGRSRPRVVRDGLEAWVRLGPRPADRVSRRAVYVMPKALSPRGGRRG